jgi:hypothetical protein
MSKKKRHAKPKDWVTLMPLTQVKPPAPKPIPNVPPKSLTKDEALNILWSAKGAFLRDDNGVLKQDDRGELVPNPNCCNAFVYASLAEAVEFHRWDGIHPVEKHMTIYTRPAGTRVLVTMISRFGDVGIRDYDITPPSNGYACRVMPEALKAWSTHP